MTVPDGTSELDWVICHEEQREVVAGKVACPTAGASVPIDDCLECRHLSHVPNDRRASLWCSTEAPADDPSKRSGR